MALRFLRDRPELAPILEVFTAALDAVDPALAVRRALRDHPMEGTPTVVAVGKAAPAMARGVPGAVTGIVVSDHVEPLPDGFVSFVGAHPIPDERSVEAARAVVSVVDETDGPILFLISGGSSTLCELPAEGLSIDDVAMVTGALLESGADIGSINAVRKHVSSLKGGRLGARTAGREARTLIMSDVVGDRLDTIGSGPTVPDPTTFADAAAVIERYSIPVPDGVAALLAAGGRGEREETPTRLPGGHTVEVVANAAVAAEAAAHTAGLLGFDARVWTTGLEGDAQTAAIGAVTGPVDSGMTFFAGETTVTVTGGGVGGRNQHAALAAALALDGDAGGVVFGALATDGVDGPTDAAGAVVDAGTVTRGRDAGLDALAYFSNYASHPFLLASGDLLRIGPSGTNVGDLWVVWRR